MLLGASFDTPQANLEFATDQEVPFALLSDPTGDIAEAYGVKRPVGARWAAVPERRTFIIDPDGVVRAVYDVTDVFHHPQQVLDTLTALVRGTTSER